MIFRRTKIFRVTCRYISKYRLYADKKSILTTWWYAFQSRKIFRFFFESATWHPGKKPDNQIVESIVLSKKWRARVSRHKFDSSVNGLWSVAFENSLAKIDANELVGQYIRRVYVINRIHFSQAFRALLCHGPRSPNNSARHDGSIKLK